MSKNKISNGAGFTRPRFITSYSFPSQPQPTSVILLDAYRAAFMFRQMPDSPELLTLPYKKSRKWAIGHCFRHVADTISKEGGKAVYGWRLRIDSTGNNTNSLEMVEAVGHAVWESAEGVLWEVSPDSKGMTFVRSGLLSDGMGYNVGFVDDEFHAATYRPAPSLGQLLRYMVFYIPAPR